MSSSKEFVIKRIDEIAEALPQIQLRYEHREVHGEHIIEVSPKYLYEDDSEFEEHEISLYKDFIDLFPDETILVISSDDIIEVESLTHVACRLLKKWALKIKENVTPVKGNVAEKFDDSYLSEIDYSKAA